MATNLRSSIGFLLICAATAAPESFNRADSAKDAGQLTSTGATYSLGGINYFAPPQSEGTLSRSKISLKEDSAIPQHLPLTVLVTDDSKSSQATLERTIDAYKAHDDVFQESFLNSESCNGNIMKAPILTTR